MHMCLSGYRDIFSHSYYSGYYLVKFIFTTITSQYPSEILRFVPLCILWSFSRIICSVCFEIQTTHMMECRVLFMTTLPSNVPYQSMEQQTFSEEQLREFREVFSIFDSDKDGAISSSELVKVLKWVEYCTSLLCGVFYLMVNSKMSLSCRTCGLSPTESQVEILIKHIDTNGNGMVSLKSFCKNIFKDVLSLGKSLSAQT